MTATDALAFIESKDFIARISVASNLATLLRALSNVPEVTFILSRHADKELAKQLLTRVARLVGTRVDPRYENPYDTPLTVYLAILNQMDPSLGRFAAQMVSEARGCWWAERVSRSILFGGQVVSSASSSKHTLLLGPEPRTVRESTSAHNVVVGDLPDLRGFNRTFALRSTISRTPVSVRSIAA